MADITRYPFVRHLRGTTTGHVRHLRNGRTLHAGIGRSFWFRPLSAVLSEVPVDDRELPLIVHATSADFQDVTVQATITFRFTDPEVVAARIDFSIDPASGRWRSTPLDQVAALLTQAAQQYALDLVAAEALTDVLVSGVSRIRQAVLDGLRGDERLADLALYVVAVRVVAIRPEPEMGKALQTPTREQVQQAADRATFERRALAVERERAIGENELQTQIELARREQELVAQRGTNALRQAEEAARAERVSSAAEGERRTVLAQADADGTRAKGLAAADAEGAMVGTYRDLPSEILLGLAFQELARNLPQIGSVVLTPELLSPLLARLGAGGSPGEEP